MNDFAKDEAIYAQYHRKSGMDAFNEANHPRDANGQFGSGATEKFNKPFQETAMMNVHHRGVEKAVKEGNVNKSREEGKQLAHTAFSLIGNNSDPE